MTYATLATLTERFGERLLVQLTDRADPPAGSVDEAVVDRALADTDAQIDGYLAARYVLPMAETPPAVVDLANAIAIYKLHVYGGDPKFHEDYRDAIRTLEQIAKGVIRLSVEGIAAAATGGGGARLTDRERPFTAENMKGFV